MPATIQHLNTARAGADFQLLSREVCVSKRGPSGSEIHNKKHHRIPADAVPTTIQHINKAKAGADFRLPSLEVCVSMGLPPKAHTQQEALSSALPSGTRYFTRLHVPARKTAPKTASKCLGRPM